MRTAMLDSQLEHSVALKSELDQARLHELEFSDAMAKAQEDMAEMRAEAVSADATAKDLRSKLAAQTLRVTAELHSMASIVEGCVATTEALRMQVQCVHSAVQSSGVAHTHEMGLLKTKLAALEREQQQVCSERDDARQQAAECMDKARTSAHEHHIWKHQHELDREEFERENLRALRQREAEMERQIAEAVAERERALRTWEVERDEVAQQRERERECWMQEKEAERASLEEQWAREKDEIEQQWRQEIASLKDTWASERGLQEEKWMQARQSLEDEWARAEREREEETRAEKVEREEEMRAEEERRRGEREEREKERQMDRAEKEAESSKAKAAISALEQQVYELQTGMDTAQIARVSLHAEAEGLSKQVSHCRARLAQAAETVRRTRHRCARSCFFLSWHTQAFQVRGARRTIASLARLCGTRCASVGGFRMWRQLVRRWQLLASKHGQMQRSHRLVEQHVKCAHVERGFSGWKSVYSRRQIVRTCASLARHKTTSISLARVVALWRQQPLLHSLLLAFQTRGHEAMHMRRAHKVTERVVELWRGRCETFAHVTTRLLDISSQIRRRLLQSMLTEFRRLLFATVTSRRVRYGKARYLADQTCRQAMSRTFQIFKRLIQRSRNRRRVCSELLPGIVRDESAAALQAWWLYRSTCQKVRKLLANVCSRQKNQRASLAFDALCIRASAARQWRLRRVFHEACSRRTLLEDGWAAFVHQLQHFQSQVKHQHTAFIVLRSRRREIEMQRLRASVRALQRHTQAMLHVKSILSLSAGFASPRPLLIAHAGVGRGQTPNHAYRLASSAVGMWQAGMGVQAAFREATRRVIISRRKSDKEMDSAFDAALVRARGELRLLRSFNAWRWRSAEASSRHPPRTQRVGGLVSHDIHRIVQGVGKLAHVVGFPLQSVLDGHRLAKCSSAEGLLHELNIACALALELLPVPEANVPLLDAGWGAGESAWDQGNSHAKAKQALPLHGREAHAKDEDELNLHRNLALEARKRLEQTFSYRAELSSAACAPVAPLVLRRAQDKENHIFQKPWFPDQASARGVVSASSTATCFATSAGMQIGRGTLASESGIHVRSPIPVELSRTEECGASVGQERLVGYEKGRVDICQEALACLGERGGDAWHDLHEQGEAKERLGKKTYPKRDVGVDRQTRVASGGAGRGGAAVAAAVNQRPQTVEDVVAWLGKLKFPLRDLHRYQV